MVFQPLRELHMVPSFQRTLDMVSQQVHYKVLGRTLGKVCQQVFSHGRAPRKEITKNEK